MVGQSPVSSTHTPITPTSFLVSLVFVYLVHTTLENKPRIAISPGFLYRYTQYASSDTLTTSLVSEISVSRKENPCLQKDEKLEKLPARRLLREKHFRPRDKLDISRSRNFASCQILFTIYARTDWSIITLLLIDYDTLCVIWRKLEILQQRPGTIVLYYFGAYESGNFAFRFPLSDMA